MWKLLRRNKARSAAPGSGSWAVVTRPGCQPQAYLVAEDGTRTPTELTAAMVAHMAAHDERVAALPEDPELTAFAAAAAQVDPAPVLVTVYTDTGKGVWTA